MVQIYADVILETLLLYCVQRFECVSIKLTLCSAINMLHTGPRLISKSPLSLQTSV